MLFTNNMQNYHDKSRYNEPDTALNQKSKIMPKSEMKQRFDENNRRLKTFMDNYAKFFREQSHLFQPLSWSTSTITNEGSDSDD